MSLLSRLFGSNKPTDTAQPETYNGMRIYAEPMREGNTYRLSARIEQDIDGTTREHRLIRADTFQDADAAASAAIAKAKQMIDEQGDRLFD
ncbi:HlyU family transcriptional regulator [Yoonia sp. 2307UL14-13]|uniref:HlyU family transcriptional regulator n=1 Tax=Yoonia sp. 2307UL14-13 TaxID=3126506 RepID=UPI0030AAF6DA